MAETIASQSFVSNSEIDARKRAELEKDRAASKAAAMADKPEISGLTRYVQTSIEDAKTYREETGIEDTMLEAIRQRKGQYDEETAAKIAEIGAPDIYMRITDVKCRAAEAWLHQLLGFDAERPVGFRPTPIPDIPGNAVQGIIQKTMQSVSQQFQQSGEIPPPEEVFNFAADMRDSIMEQIQVEAATRAKRMEQTIYDQLAYSTWEKTFLDFVQNLATFPVAMIKGPIVTKKKGYVWKSGRNYPTVEMKERIIFYAPHPMDIYPSRTAVTANDGDMHERIRFTRKSLADLIDTEGYDATAIKGVLASFGDKGYTNQEAQDSTRNDAENKGPSTEAVSGVIEGWESWLSVSGALLVAHGITKDLNGRPIRVFAEYDANTILVANTLIYVSLNADPLDERPYFVECWARQPNSFWGSGVPHLMKDIQRTCNATMRALLFNEGMCAGPQFVYPDISRLPPGEAITDQHPGKTHVFTNVWQSGEKPFYALNIESNANELMRVYDYFSQLAGEYTGIPAYEQGLPMGGVGRTVGGLSLLMSNGARAVRHIVMRIDANILIPVMRKLYEWNMQYNPDESIKGDVDIVPEGILARLIREEMSGKRLQFLAQTNNPADLELTGLPGRAEVLRAAARTLDLPDTVVRSEEDVEAQEIRRRTLMEQQAQEQAGQGAVA